MTEADVGEIARLRASEAEYRALFDAIDEGVTTIEPIYDAEGRCVDARYDESNAAPERMTVLRDIAGKLVSEVIPDLEPQWLERYARIVRTGTSERFQDFAAGLGRWFDAPANCSSSRRSPRTAIPRGRPVARHMRRAPAACMHPSRV